jgi:hypothetical protein
MLRGPLPWLAVINFRRLKIDLRRMTITQAKGEFLFRVSIATIIMGLGLLGGEEVQTSVKFVKLPSPHPGSFLKAPMPLPMGEGGRRETSRGRGGRVNGPWPIEPHFSAV